MVRRLAGRDVSPASAAALGALCCGPVLGGVLLMHRTDPALAALPTGVLQTIFAANPQWVLLGTICLLLGCLGVFFWLPVYPQADTSITSPLAASDGRIRLFERVGGRRLAVMSLLAGAAVYAYVLVQAQHRAAGVPALAGLVVATACFGVALGCATRPLDQRMPRLQQLTWLDYLAVAAIIGAFMITNAHDLRNWVYAYVGDEWFFYQAALAIAHGAPFDAFNQAGVYGFNPIADSLYQATVMRALGSDVTGWRMSCVLATALPVAALYWGAKQIGGSALAVTASVLYASCPLLWAFTHIGYTNSDPLLFVTLAAALFFVGWRDERAVFLYAAGALGGACWYSFFGSRPLIAVLVLAMLTDWRGGWPALARRSLCLLAGFAIVVLPLFLDNGAATITQMVQPNRLVSGASAHTLLVQNTVRALYEFVYATVDHHYTVGALFDVLSASALCVGITLALRNLRAHWSRLLLIWFLIALGTTTPLNYAPEVSVTRSMVVVPPAALLAALGLCSLCASVAALGSRHAYQRLFALGLSGALVVVILLNGFHFFKDATSLPHRWPAYPVVVMTVEAITNAPGSAFILPSDMPAQNANGDLCTVLDGFQIDPWTVLSLRGGAVAPYCATGTTAATRSVSAVLLLLDDGQAAAHCTVLPTVVYRENQGSLWAFRLSVLPAPVGVVTRSILPRVRQVCPALLY